MSGALSRKRCRIDLDDDEERREPLPLLSPLLTPSSATLGDALKRTRTQEGLDEVCIIDPEEAWSVDVEAILSSATAGRSLGSTLCRQDSLPKYDKDTVIVFCVQGNMQLHQDLLCSMLPTLYQTSPSLQAFVLCRDPTAYSSIETSTLSLPRIQAVGPNYNHFVRLGLLHPLGGGEHPLDALVVIDAKWRRRLVLPFGWGAGRHADSPAGKVVCTRLTELLHKCVRTLVQEQ